MAGRYRRGGAWLAFVLVAGGCGAPDAGAPHTGRTAAAAGSDPAIAEALYLDRRTPPGFNTVELPAAYAGAFVTIYHVSADEAGAGGEPRRLCSDDFAQAHAWAEAAALAKPVYRDLVDTAAGDLYYEFVRVHPQQPQVVHLARIYRCDRYRPEVAGAPARITARPLDAATVRRALEYAWWFSAANNHGTAVIDAGIERVGGAWVHRLWQAELSSGAGGCDDIDIYREERSVDWFDGAVAITRVWQRRFRSRYAAGAVALCP